MGSGESVETLDRKGLIMAKFRHSANLLGLGDSDDDFYYDPLAQESGAFDDVREEASGNIMTSDTAAVELRRAQAEYAAGNVSALNTRRNAALYNMNQTKKAIATMTAKLSNLKNKLKGTKAAAAKATLQKHIAAQNSAITAKRALLTRQTALVRQLETQMANARKIIAQQVGLRPSGGGGGGGGGDAPTAKPGTPAASSSLPVIPLIGLAALLFS